MPVRVVSRDGFVSVQVNVDPNGNNIIGDAANEPSIAVDPTNPNRMVIGWRQFDSVLSDFRQAGWAYTTDGGQTWTFPGVIDPGVLRSDPVIDADAEGNFYYNSLSPDAGYACTVFKSTDGGATWDTGTFAWGGDKAWQAIDTTNSPGRGNIYIAWSAGDSICSPMEFTRSTDGGHTFEACTAIAEHPYWGTIAVGPDGEVYACGYGFVVAKSVNAKYAGQTPQWTHSYVSLDGLMVGWIGPNPGGLTGQAWVAVDSSSGPTHGYVYLLCSVQRNSIIDPCDLMFARSNDGGQTWSAPVRINDDPTENGAWQWFGTLAVAPNGRIDAAWCDTRHDPGGYVSELYYSYSIDAGQTWSPNVALSPPFDPHVGWPVQPKIGDYYDMTSAATDTHLAYAATFNNEQDVYYLDIRRRLQIGYPNGLPRVLAPGVPPQITVRICEGDETYVPGTAAVHVRYFGGDFQTLPLAPLGGNQFRATLPAPYCGAAPELYFTAEGTSGGVVFDPPSAPADVYISRVGQVAAFYTQNLDTDPGWTTQGLWAFGRPTGQGGYIGYPDPTAGHTGLNVYGYNLNGDYEDSLPPRYLTSTPLDCTDRQGVRLSYWRWLGVETPRRDHAYLDVSNDGATWWPLWQNWTEVFDDAWVPCEFDLSPYADNQATVYLRWTMGPTSFTWPACGWNIDDIVLTAVACDSPPTQPGDLNCDGRVDFDDIGPFVLALTGSSEYGAVYPNCPWLNADCNGDGRVDFDDINAFVNVLTGH